MATLRFSQLAISNMIGGASGTGTYNSGDGQLIYTGAGTPWNNTLGGGSPASVTLTVYKGVMPTNFTTFTDTASRSGDVLWTAPLPQASWQFNGLVGTAIRWTLGLQAAQVTASASGTATWFLLARSPSGVTSLATRAALMGTVGVTGSGADLEINSTDIISGVGYTCTGLYLNFPQTWTVA